MKLSLIIPCYNEEDVIQLFYDEVTEALIRYDKEYELIFVDDGSRDNTKKIIMELAAQNNSIKYIVFSRNFGKESAMLAGMKFAKGSTLEY